LSQAAQKALDLHFPGIELDFRNNHLHLDWRPVFWRIGYEKDGSTFPLEQFLTQQGGPSDGKDV
jgi:hypothetical protein